MVTPHPLAAATAQARTDELRARAAQYCHIKLGPRDGDRRPARRGLRRRTLLWGRTPEGAGGR